MPKAAEFRELDIDELETRLSEYRRELLNLRFQLATGQLDNVSRMGQVRRDVARVLTELRVRDVTAAEADLAAAGRSVASASTVLTRHDHADDHDHDHEHGRAAAGDEAEDAEDAGPDDEQAEEEQ